MHHCGIHPRLPFHEDEHARRQGHQSSWSDRGVLVPESDSVKDGDTHERECYFRRDAVETTSRGQGRGCEPEATLG